MEAKSRDHVVAPFECDLCAFAKLKGMYSHDNDREDKLLLKAIRRVNLDDFWSRETPMVSSTLTNAKKMIKTFKEVWLKWSFMLHVPVPEWDYCGYEMPIDTVMDSRKGARHSKNHTQFNVIRHM